MTEALVKILGTAHGLFALWTLSILPAIFKSGSLAELSRVQASIKLTATFLGIGMLLLCAVAAWQLSPNSFVYAWLALGAFVLSASSDTVALHGFAGFGRLMPMFYKAVVVRAAAATLLTVLTLSLPLQSVGG